MCLYPQMIKNPKYKKTKKNRGVIPPITDPRIAYVPIGCGDCIECRKQKQREWMARLLEDVRHNTNGKFITLTFNEKQLEKIKCEVREKIKPPYKAKEGYALENEIATYAVRMFLERWRKKFKKSLRHWLITELGHNGTERIHLHGIIWTDESVKTVEEKWENGYTWPGSKHGWKGNYVTERTVNYITKYITKKDTKHKTYKPVILTSPGSGQGIP